jgi:hypothetical protein
MVQVVAAAAADIMVVVVPVSLVVAEEAAIQFQLQQELHIHKATTWVTDK